MSMFKQLFVFFCIHLIYQCRLLFIISQIVANMFSIPPPKNALSVRVVAGNIVQSISTSASIAAGFMGIATIQLFNPNQIITNADWDSVCIFIHS